MQEVDGARPRHGDGSAAPARGLLDASVQGLVAWSFDERGLGGLWQIALELVLDEAERPVSFGHMHVQEMKLELGELDEAEPVAALEEARIPGLVALEVRIMALRSVEREAVWLRGFAFLALGYVAVFHRLRVQEEALAVWTPGLAAAHRERHL